MSSKTNKIAKDIKTKSVSYRIDVELAGEGTKTTYMVVTGVPEDLPENMMDSVKQAAEMQFASTLNSKQFLEFYNEGKNSRDEQPVFYNMTQMAWIKVKSLTEIN